MGNAVARRVALLVLPAAVVAGADLVHTAYGVANDPAIFAHPRSGEYVAFAAALSVFWTGAILLARSTSLAVAGGIALGGAAGNVASLLLWPSVEGVPDPIVWSGIAFSLGDVAVVVGVLSTVIAAVVFAVRNRHRLFDPVSAGGRPPAPA